jgi:hypothetical protein
LKVNISGQSKKNSSSACTKGSFSTKLYPLVLQENSAGPSGSGGVDSDMRGNRRGGRVAVTAKVAGGREEAEYCDMRGCWNMRKPKNRTEKLSEFRTCEMREAGSAGDFDALWYSNLM